MTDRNRKTADLERERLFRELDARRRSEAEKEARLKRRRRFLLFLVPVLFITAALVTVYQLSRMKILPGLYSTTLTPPAHADSSPPAGAPRMQISFIRQGKVLERVAVPSGGRLNGKTSWETFPHTVAYDVRIKKRVDDAWLVSFDLTIEGGAMKQERGPLHRHDVIRVRPGIPAPLVRTSPVQVLLFLGDVPESEVPSLKEKGATAEPVLPDD